MAARGQDAGVFRPGPRREELGAEAIAPASRVV